MTESSELLNRVINNNYCIGCGACASVAGSPFEMKMDEYGNIVAVDGSDPEKSNAKVMDICPFSGKAANEDMISDSLFSSALAQDKWIGKYIDCYAGYVREGLFREKGSSGGVGKWLGYTLLAEKKVDYLVQIHANEPGNPGDPLFDYKFISNKDEVIKGSRSSYYPSTMVEVIRKIREKEGRYAITGVPCFIKTLRLLSRRDKVLAERIKYTIGVICGGMKSANHSKLIAWQLGVKPGDLVAIDFRRKYDDRPASNKIYQVWSSADDKDRYRDAAQIFGTDWGSGYFKPNACDFCDDVVGETADISIGDAWLSKYVNDPKGTSVVVIRNNDLAALFKQHIENGNIKMDRISAEDVRRSQEGGFRHRREGLSHRLAGLQKTGKWHPPKRVKPGDFGIDRKRRKIYELRGKISKKSHIAAQKALENDKLEIFFREMLPLKKKYRSAYYGKRYIRALRRIKKIILSAK
ncbi:MAG: Coenzyme F420 hydrogenase/dehydrogenase, beta subunit C-terminal domain [Bacteroidales bacterium]|nr:Coenzyme F420 hydrogenase/dehydrogenase, beta subunit C-terminal domain [Bacteroidales bacterium]